MALETGKMRRSLPANFGNSRLPKISNELKLKSYVQSPQFGQPQGGGRSYFLSKSPQTHYNLPPASLVQPEQEIPPGQLDSWPVHSIKPVASGRRSKLGDSLSQSLSGRITPTIPKPKFLEHLEEFLQKELRLLGCPPQGPCELRVQAHREVFEHLMEDFKTYKPLLSAIKNEYDLYINYLQQEIAELQPLKTHLFSVKEECNRKILAMRDSEKADLEEARQENRKLLSTIDRLKETELSLRSQVDKLQAELRLQYEQYKNEADARKLLISDINDLKFRQQEQKAEDSSEEREDPVILKLKLQRGREDLKAAHQRINRMLADYGDVLPRREHDQLQKAYGELEGELEKTKNDYITLMADHNALQGMCKDMRNEMQELMDNHEKLKRSATPRPDWARCAGYIEGGTDKWDGLAEGKSSDQMVDILLAQIAGVDVSEITKEEAFQGQGTSDEVPLYLRAEGSIRNRRISKDEGSRMISGFWKYKLSNSSENLDKQLDESVYDYLLSINESDQTKAIEDGYNLHDCCSRFAHEPFFALFTRVLSGDVDELMFTWWMSGQAKLAEILSTLPHEGGKMTVENFQSGICSCWPHKPLELVSRLVATAKLMQKQQQGDQDPNIINYITTLSPDSNGHPSPFAIQLLEQYQNETKTFVKDLMKNLTDKSEVSVGQLREAMLALEPNRPEAEVDQTIGVAFSISTGQLIDDSLVVPTEQLSERLNSFPVFRS